MKYNEKDKVALIKSSVKTFDLSYEQAEKRVNKLIEAIDGGLFDGIPDTGPADYLQQMFVRVKTEQIMNTQID